MNRSMSAIAAVGFTTDCAASRRFKHAGVRLTSWQRQLVCHTGPIGPPCLATYGTSHWLVTAAAILRYTFLPCGASPAVGGFLWRFPDCRPV